MIQVQFPQFWSWLIRGSGGKPGYRRILNRWLVLHGVVGLALAWIVPVPLAQCSNAVLLPLAGIIIGLAFAWAGNAQALLSGSEMEDVADQHKGGFVEYVYVYQTAILLILTTLVVWSLAGMSVFDVRWPTPDRAYLYFVVKTVLFGLSSIALRECWHVVLGAQWMLLAQKTVKQARKSNRTSGNDPKAEQ